MYFVLITVYRSWRTGLANGACALVCTSVVYGSGGQSQGHAGDRQGNVLASHYFIQPCGAGKSSLIHLEQIDFGCVTHKYNIKIYHDCNVFYFLFIIINYNRFTISLFISLSNLVYSHSLAVLK
jgi:hypothetical protein